MGGMELSEMQQLKALEDENRRLKQIVAEQALEIQALKANTLCCRGLGGPILKNVPACSGVSVPPSSVTARASAGSRWAARSAAVRQDGLVRRDAVFLEADAVRQFPRSPTVMLVP